MIHIIYDRCSPAHVLNLRDKGEIVMMYVNEEWYNFIHELHQLTEKHNQQIKQFEKTVENMQNKLNALEKTTQERNKHMIDKIEYHFDQLKIEHLDGTLHIGMSPNDLENIEDLKDAPELAADDHAQNT